MDDLKPLDKSRQVLQGQQLRGYAQKEEQAVKQVAPSACSPAIPKPLQEGYIPCPRCHGAGWLRHDVPYGHPAFGKAVKCQCHAQKQAKSLSSKAHIPDDLRNASFESYLRFPLSLPQQQAAMQVQAFVLRRLTSSYNGQKRSLYLYGLWGVGKTGLAISALNLVLQEGKTGLYLPTIDLFESLYEAIAASQRIRQGYGEKADKEEESTAAKLLRQMERVTWLVLDDLGVECSSRFVIQRLYHLIESRRARSGLYTIFTSNKDASGLEQHWGEEGSHKRSFDDGRRIIERLGESCVPIHVTGYNLRERKPNPPSC
jgi:DNA replication protein DnaC